MKNIYGNVNTYKTKEERMTLLSLYRRRLLLLLKEGYNPYLNNTELYQTKTNPKPEEKAPIKLVEAPSGKIPPVVTPENDSPLTDTQNEENTTDKLSLREGFDFSLNLKAKTVSERTLQDYQYASNAVVKWIDENNPEIKTIDQFSKKIALGFLNAVLLNSSARSRNNYRLSLSSLLQTLEDNEIIVSNPMKKIANLKSIPKRNKTYSTEDQEKIFAYLKVEDPILLLYIQFISYNFLRPIEACRLKIKDFNLTNNTIQFKAKNSPLKTKLIPQILLNELPDLSKLNPEAFLFTPDKIGGDWNATESNRRDHFSKRFKKSVKDHFNLDKNQNLYSFRHTFITKLYRSLVESSSAYAAKSELMGITGHTTMDALEKYLRDIDAELPKDYSHHF
ncbi:tyrosine-type recombinase/integrase [Mariniflexile sp.]|uniref:tyrosine-type recombinase/integrase n=1 Tax=Mariniflexile sp. TaxID=1979402 RepID=UPI003562212C